ncbi:MAG: hypothetical protein AAF485_09645 [Chloroflexota bacterium]
MITVLRRKAPVSGTISIEALQKWTPTKVAKTVDHYRLFWKNISPEASNAKNNHQDVISTDMTILEEMLKRYPTDAPHGFIFHTGYCGSRLLSNALERLYPCLSLYQPAPIEQISFRPDISEDQWIIWLQGLINACRQRASKSDTPCFVTFPPSLLLKTHLIRHAFPDTPWLCLYRHPVEIMGQQFSQAQLKTRWITRDDFFELSEEARLQIGVAEGLARTLGGYYKTIETLTDESNVLCVNYNQLSGKTYKKILTHFKIDAYLKLSKQAQAIASSDPSVFEHDRKFQVDEAVVGPAALSIIREMADKWALTAYHSLEQYTMK